MLVKSLRKKRNKSLKNMYINNGLPEAVAEKLTQLNLFIPPITARFLRDIVTDEDAIRIFLLHPGNYNGKRFHWLQLYGVEGYRTPRLTIQLPVSLEIQLSDLVKILFAKDPKFFDVESKPIVKRKETVFALACKMCKCNLTKIKG